MATAGNSRIETLFARALEVDPDDQAAFLKEHCADDERRAEVGSLLNAHENAGRFFADLRACVSAPELEESGLLAPTAQGKEVASPPDPLGMGDPGGRVCGTGANWGRRHGRRIPGMGPQLGRSVAQGRFVKEAQAAARLDPQCGHHPRDWRDGAGAPRHRDDALRREDASDPDGAGRGVGPRQGRRGRSNHCGGASRSIGSAWCTGTWSRPT